MAILKENKVTLCWPNYTNQSMLAGGSWATNLPVNNLKTPYLSECAVSNDLNLSSTKWSCKFIKFKPVFVVALANHNLSSNAQWRIRLRPRQGESVMYDSGWIMVWPSIYSSQELEWEFDNFWLGTIDNEDRDNFTSLITHFLPDSYVCSYMEIEIDDTSNPQGFIKIGRQFVADAFQSQVTASYGISYGWEIGTTFETALDEGQTEYADVKSPKRTVDFDFNKLTQEEAWSRIQRLRRDQGLHGEVLYTENPYTLSPESFSKTFIARQTSVDALTRPYYQNHATSFSLKEIL